MRGRKDLEEDGAAVQAEARAVDVKVKSAEAGEAAPAGNIELLKKIQDDKWESYEWFDAEVDAIYLYPFLSWILRANEGSNRAKKHGLRMKIT
jgi:DNA-directed RNA polymerase